MLKGVSGVRRIAAILSIGLVTLLVTGPGAGAAAPVDLSQYSAIGSGQVLNVKLTLPKAVTDAVNVVLGAVPLPSGDLSLPQTIDETISVSRSIGGMVNGKVTGSSIGRMFDGSLDKTVLEPVVSTVFPERAGKGLPIAEAVLGGVEHAVDSLANLEIPAAAPLIKLGLMNVEADSTPVQNVKAALSSGKSTLANITVDLAPQIKALLKEAAAPLTTITDNTLIPQLNSLLGTITGTLEEALDIQVNLELPKIADLLDRPLLHIGKIETSSSTDALGRVRSATGFSRITNLNIFGTSAENALVHVGVLTSDVSAAIDGTAAGAKATAIQEIAGLSVLDNEIAVFNDKIKVLNKEIPVSLEAVSDVLNQVTGLVGQTLGLSIKTFSTHKQASAMYSTASSQTLKIGFHPNITGVGELLGLDIEAPSALAEVAGDSVRGVPLPGPCVGSQCAPTGVADTAYLLVGPMLLGGALMVRRFALSK